MIVFCDTTLCDQFSVSTVIASVAKLWSLHLHSFPPEDILWGYPDPLSSYSEMLLPPEEVRAPGKFGFFAGKNGTSDGRVTIRGGELAQ